MLSVATILCVGSAIISISVNKKLVQRLSVGHVTNTMFLFAAIFSILIFVAEPPAPDQTWYIPGIALLGIVNSMVAWLYSRALKRGLAKSALFQPASGIVGITLSAIFLGEWKLLEPTNTSGLMLILGIIATTAAAIIFGKGKSESIVIRREWLTSIVGFIVLGGVVTVAMKYLAVKHIPLPVYLLSWYTGSYVGSFFPRLVEKNWQLAIAKKDLLPFIIVSATAMISLAGYFKALELAPAAVVVPLVTIGIVVGSIGSSIIIFREQKKFGLTEWVGLLIGFVGVLLLTLR
ncbi:MAG: hypothetical protein AAB408_00340 [Patescibacteria group bacterium]